MDDAQNSGDKTNVKARPQLNQSPSQRSTKHKEEFIER